MSPDLLMTGDRLTDHITELTKQQMIWGSTPF